MLPWIQAWRTAVPAFYQREHPAAHFRTATHGSSAVAEALAALVLHLADELGTGTRNDGPPLDVVDVGGGDGELLVALMERLDELDPELAARCRPVVVELRPRPAELPDRIGWVVGAAPEAVPHGLRGLLVAHELLDDVPLEVLEVDDAGRMRTVLVDPATGGETIGDETDATSRDWCAQWWPTTTPGQRVEVGLSRDRMWTGLTGRLERGMAVAVDYAHTTANRVDGRWARGTLTGYRNGHQVHPVPDGSMNLTAHVALDSCAAAADTAELRRGVASSYVIVSQRDALSDLLPHAAAPARVQPGLDQLSPQERLAAIATSSRHAEAVDPDGLGRFTWLLQCFGVEPPASMR